MSFGPVSVSTCAKYELDYDCLCTGACSTSVSPMCQSQICILQSASTEYFRKARCFLMDHGRLEQVPQFVINPEDTAFTNLTSTCTNTMALNLWPVYLSADIAMHGIAAAVAQDKDRIAELQKAITGEAASISASASKDLPVADVPTSCFLTPASMSPLSALPLLVAFRKQTKFFHFCMDFRQTLTMRIQCPTFTHRTAECSWSFLGT
jgi:hypothetical protein